MTRARGEWPLVAFTLLGQAAVGMFVALGVARLLLQRDIGDGTLAAIFGGPVLTVGALFAAAMAASTRHLARPGAAWRALRHVSGSWVSLEVALAAAFGVAVALFGAVEFLDLGPSDVHEIVAGVAASIGVGFILAMGQVYRLPARPAWDHVTTPIAFFSTTAWLGVLAAATSLLPAADVALGPAGQYPERLLAMDRALRPLLGASVGLSVLEALLLAVQYRVRRLASAQAALPERARERARGRRAVAWRVALTMAAGAAAAWFAFRQPPLSGAEPVGAAAVVVALAGALVASAIGRTGFYADRPRNGV